MSYFNYSGNSFFKCDCYVWNIFKKWFVDLDIPNTMFCVNILIFSLWINQADFLILVYISWVNSENLAVCMQCCHWEEISHHEYSLNTTECCPRLRWRMQKKNCPSNQKKSPLSDLWKRQLLNLIHYKILSLLCQPINNFFPLEYSDFIFPLLIQNLNTSDPLQMPALHRSTENIQIFKLVDPI